MKSELGRQGLKIMSGMAVLTLIGGIGVYLTVVKPRRFDRDRWLAGDERARTLMLPQLCRHHDLQARFQGKPFQQLLEFLGQPDRMQTVAGNATNQAIYGTYPSLVIERDQAETVISVNCGVRKTLSP